MKKLNRSRDDKWLGGVCGGIADYTGLDANLIRLFVAVGAILGFGSLVLAYIVAWILIPARPPAARDVWTQATDAPTTANEPPPPSA